MSQPQQLGKYELVGVLGKGAMGVVYRAFDPDIHRTVAIKTIRKDVIDDDEHAAAALARFKNEARAAGRLSHPGIVAVYDYGESGAVTYIAMEFVEGTSLREYLARGTRFAEPDVVSIMVQLLDALHHAHEQGVWHRDVKPANLIITRDGRLKVTDFGIARIDTSQLTLTGVVMGSPGYMAPEQYTGGTVDQRSDLFAAGVVLYQLLTGEHAFSGTTAQAAYRICHEHPPPPSVADPGRDWEHYDAVVAQALAKQPEARFATAEAFRTAILDAYAAPATPTVSEETLIREPALESPGTPPAPARTGVTPADSSPAPAGSFRDQSEHDTVVLGTGPTAESPVSRRWWPIGAAAAALLSLAIVVGMLVGRKPEAPPKSPAKAPAAAPARATPPPEIDPDKRQARVAQPTTSRPAAKQEPPAPSAERPEPPRKAVPASTAKAAAKEAERKVPAVASPAKPATKEPDRKLAAATGAPKPAAKEPERKAAPAKPAPSAPAPSQSGEAPTQGGGFWSDQGLTLRVQSKLQFSRMWDSNSGIVVAVRNGVVTLTGTVPERGDIAEAGRLAASVAGVKSVRNELKVGPAK